MESASVASSAAIVKPDLLCATTKEKGLATANGSLPRCNFQDRAGSRNEGNAKSLICVHVGMGHKYLGQDIRKDEGLRSKVPERRVRP